MAAIALRDDDVRGDPPNPIDLPPDRRGSLAVTPLAEVLEQVLEAGLTGTLTLLPEEGGLEDARVVLCEGIPIAAQLPYQCSDLEEGLRPLLAMRGTFLFHEDEDLTDADAVVTGIVDPARLLARLAGPFQVEADLAIEIEHDSLDFVMAALVEAADAAMAARARPDEPMAVAVAPTRSAGGDLCIIDPYEETRDDFGRAQAALDAEEAARPADHEPAEPPAAPPGSRPAPALEVPEVVELEQEAAAALARARAAQASFSLRVDVVDFAEEPGEPEAGEEPEEAEPLELALVPGAPAVARQLAPPAPSRRPGDAEAARLGYQDARRLAATGRLDQAICRLAAVLRLDPDEPTYQVALAATLMRRYPGPDAPQDRILAALDRALRLEPGCAEAHHLKGLALLAHDRRKALKHLERAVELDPGNAEAQRTLARARRATSPIARLLRGMGRKA